MQEKDKKQNNPTVSEKIVEYIDIVNYQLREPVSNIFASLPILAENINNNNTEAALENLNAVYRRTYSVIKSVNNLSFVSKLQSGYKYSKEVIDFSQLVKNVFQSSQMVLPQYFSLEYTADDGCIVKGNHSLLSMALFNLLLNSLDYCQEDVAVKVTLKKENNKCVLVYRDNSKGIRPEVIGNVFQPFYSVDPYNDGEITNKLGLGLYIAKQAVEYAGGSILMQSEFGKGVNIVISIPQCSECEVSVVKSKAGEFMLNKYSDLYVQLCDYCELPDLL